MKTLISFALIWFSFSGCAPTILTTKVNGLTSVQTNEEEQLKVFKEGEPVRTPYQIVGKIFVQKRGETIFNKPSPDAMLDLMQTPAKKIGADGLVGFHSSIYCGEEPKSIKRWGSALAIRFADSTATENNSIDFTVSILPVVNPDTTLDLKERTEYDTLVRYTAQYHLERLGYYAALSSLKGISDIEDLKKLPASALDTLGGKDSRNLLLLRLEDLSGTNIGIAAGSYATLKGYLFSKVVRDTVWTSSGSGSAARFGLISVLIPGRDESAVYSALANMFESLQPKNE